MTPLTARAMLLTSVQERPEVATLTSSASVADPENEIVSPTFHVARLAGVEMIGRGRRVGSPHRRRCCDVRVAAQVPGGVGRAHPVAIRRPCGETGVVERRARRRGDLDEVRACSAPGSARACIPSPPTVVARCRPREVDLRLRDRGGGEVRRCSSEDRRRSAGPRRSPSPCRSGSAPASAQRSTRGPRRCNPGSTARQGVAADREGGRARLHGLGSPRGSRLACR